jgi:hypothetical protein
MAICRARKMASCFMRSSFRKKRRKSKFTSNALDFEEVICVFVCVNTIFMLYLIKKMIGTCILYENMGHENNDHKTKKGTSSTPISLSKLINSKHQGIYNKDRH